MTRNRPLLFNQVNQKGHLWPFQVAARGCWATLQCGRARTRTQQNRDNVFGWARGAACCWRRFGKAIFAWGAYSSCVSAGILGRRAEKKEKTDKSNSSQLKQHTHTLTAKSCVDSNKRIPPRANTGSRLRRPTEYCAKHV